MLSANGIPASNSENTPACNPVGMVDLYIDSDLTDAYIAEVVPEKRRVNRPTTVIETQSKAVAVTYNPGMMSIERAEDLFMAGVSFMATPFAVLLNLHWIAVATLLLSAMCLYDGLKRPADEQGK